MQPDVSGAQEYNQVVLEKLRQKLKRRSKTPQELAEEEAIRRQAQQERHRAEARMDQQRQDIDASGSGGNF
jgi:hypothetical protein